MLTVYSVSAAHACRLQQHFELSTMHWQFVSNVFLEFGALNMETSTDTDCTIDYLKFDKIN